MKKNKNKGKLDLKKSTITTLNKEQLIHVIGGDAPMRSVARKDLTSISCIPWPTSVV